METAILAMASSSATAAGTSAALASGAGVATASQVALSAPVLLSAAGTAATAGLGLFGAASAVQSGRYQSAAYKSQAQQFELSARAEELKGRDQADKIRRTLQSTLASQNAAFAARGISLNSGTPRTLATQSMADATADIQRAQFGADYASTTARMNAGQSIMAARQARVQSYLTASGGLLGSAKLAGAF